jgi:hypothetical protein
MILAGYRFLYDRRFRLQLPSYSQCCPPFPGQAASKIPKIIYNDFHILSLEERLAKDYY